MENDGVHFICNECGATVSKEDVARLVLEMESTDETCPHCGKLNHIEGFSQVLAFVCRHCAQGVTL